MKEKGRSRKRRGTGAGDGCVAVDARMGHQSHPENKTEYASHVALVEAPSSLLAGSAALPFSFERE